MNAGRLIRAIRLEATLAGAAYLGLLVVSNPHSTAAILDLREYPGANRAFDAGMVVAMAALGCLAIRLGARLLDGGRRRPETGECRAVAGTVMAEFALVLPLVLLVMCMIAQLALIANASLVVRYAAFAAARSAIVSFEADMPKAFINNPASIPQFPPAWEWVDKTRPTLAAQLVLASISPQAGAASSPGKAMERMLAQQGGAWDGRAYAARTAYASAATRVRSIDDLYGRNFAGFRKSVSPLIQRSEHIIAPWPWSQGERTFYVPGQPPAQLIPPRISVQPPPIQPSIGPIQLPPITLPPITVDISAIANPVNKGVGKTVNLLKSGSAAAIDLFAESPFNKDLFSPKRVAIQVEYDFLLTLPGLQFIPGLTKPAPLGTGRAFQIRHTVWLQSTGGRRANITAFIPIPKQIRKGAFRENFLFYWVWPPN